MRLRLSTVVTLALACGAGAFAPAARRPIALAARGAALSSSTSAAAAEQQYAALAGLEVLSATDGSPVAVTSLWRDDQRAVVAFFRSFG